MPITWRASNGGGWIDVLFSNPYTTAESEKIMKEIYADPALTRPLRFLVDVRQSTPPDTEFVINAINFWQLHVADMWGAKVAVVAATEGQVGMGQMSASSAQGRELPFIVRVFRDAEWNDAERWLDAE